MQCDRGLPAVLHQGGAPGGTALRVPLHLAGGHPLRVRPLDLRRSVGGGQRAVVLNQGLINGINRFNFNSDPGAD